MAFIVETIAGDKRIQIGAENFVRQMGIGPSWRKLRIGLLLSFNDTGADVSGSTFVVGVIQGTQYAFDSDNCVDFIGAGFPGITFDSTSFTRQAGPPARLNVSNAFTIKKVGATRTTGSMTLPSGLNFADATGTYKSAFYLDITKGSPNYAITAYASAASTDISRYTFMASLEGDTPPGMTGSDVISVAYAGSGLFDSVCIRWAKSVPTLEISEIATLRFY